MHTLVTGCTGFAGGYLVEELFAQGGRAIVGICRRPQPMRSTDHLTGKLTALLPCDLGDRQAVETVLREVRPEQIFHLAGYANPTQSKQEPDAAWDANLTATRNLCEAVLRWGGRPRILYVSSGLVYGERSSQDPLIGEDAPLRPVTPYAASKAAADLASLQYGLGSGLEIVRVRSFNHIGPRQALGFVVPDFAKQIAAIEQGLQPPTLETGNLSSRRDFTDVRDMVRAYVLLMEQGQKGEVYNVGTGEAHSMQAILDRLLDRARLRIDIRSKSEPVGRPDTGVLRADAGKIGRTTGWTPRLTLEQTLTDILEYWRKAVVRGP